MRNRPITFAEINEVSDLLNAPEGENFEFKAARNSYEFEELVKYACAIANCGGGLFILGISDRRPRKIIGSNAFSQPERTREGLINKLQIRIDFYEYKEDGKRILVFEIASRPFGLPVQADGIIWWRQGDSLVKMPQNVVRKIYNEHMESFSTDDFIVINNLFFDLKIPEKLKYRIKRLVEVGIIEQAGRQKYVLARAFYKIAGKAGARTRHVGLDRETNKELLFKHIKDSGKNGTPFSELQQVLPGHSRGQITVLLRELRGNGRIQVIGKTLGAKWYFKPQN